MYFLTALLFTIIFVLLWLFVKTKKPLHFEYGAIIFGGATAMWLIDCVASAIEGEGFISFEEIGLDLWISLWTVLAGLFLYCAIIVVPLIIKKIKEKKESK